MIDELKLHYQKMQEICSQYMEVRLEEIDSDDMAHQKIEQYLSQLPESLAQRLNCEWKLNGPLQELIQDDSLTEIFIQDYDNIWWEDQTGLHQLEDQFIDPWSYQQFLYRLCKDTNTLFDHQNPSAQGVWGSFRFHLVAPPMSDCVRITFRRLSRQLQKFDFITDPEWCPIEISQTLIESVKSRKNIVIFGTTGSGKTTVVNALMSLVGPDERLLILEDTDELLPPNKISLKLLTREKNTEALEAITMTDLVRHSLRLKPQRLMMGEIRGAEAKDWLMVQSTGHSGGMTTLHASGMQQALQRLELLVQMGAPQWSRDTVKDMIFQGIDLLVHVDRADSGKRYLRALHRLSSLEPGRILTEPLYEANLASSLDGHIEVTPYCG